MYVAPGEEYPPDVQSRTPQKRPARPFFLLTGSWKRSLQTKSYRGLGAADTRSSSLRVLPACTSSPDNHRSKDHQRIHRSGETPNQEIGTGIFFAERLHKLCKKRISINILVSSLLILSGVQVHFVLHDLAPITIRQQEENGGYNKKHVGNIRKAVDSGSAKAFFAGWQSHNDSERDSSNFTHNTEIVEAEEMHRSPDDRTESVAATGFVPVRVDNKEFNVVPIPEAYANLADFASEPSSEFSPIFWHIPKSGGSTVKDVIGGCIGLTLASEVGGAFEYENDDALEVVNIQGSSFVNVDTTKIAGIERAKRLGLVSSGLADVIVSLHPFQASTLFTLKHKGMMFAMFRDPVDRVVSTFNYLSMATWERTYDPSLKTMSIQDFARKGKIADNWMTRTLTNERVAKINDDHLVTAKEIVRTKILVGLLDKAVESFGRFHMYFGWKPKGKVPLHGRLGCVKDLLLNGVNRSNRTVSVEEGSEAYQLLYELNKFDMELYLHAVATFEKQARYFE